MPRNWTDQYTFLLGAVASPTLAFFVTHDDETASERIPYSSFLTLRENEWSDGGTREWPTVSLCAIPGDMTQLMAIGEGGQVFLRGAGEEREEVIVKGDEGPATRGPLRCVRAIAGHVIAVGSDRQVYRRKGPSRWEALDMGARPESGLPPMDKVEKAADKKKVADKGRAPRAKPGPPTKRTSSAQTSVGFEAVDGYAVNEMYAVGRGGEIWQWEGTRWLPHASPTTETLTQLTCATDGHVYAAGDKGVLVRGRADRWELLRTGLTQPITGLRLYDGALYAATAKGVWRLEGDKLVAVPLPKKDPPKTFGMLDTESVTRTRGALWSIGPKDIFTYDGKTWTRIE